MTKRMRAACGSLFVAMGMLIAAESIAADSDAWLTDYEKAREQAAEKKLPILIDFTGSDWCIWCKRLDAEVFSKEAFKEYAKDNLVLFKADFPMRKEQEPAIKQRNRELQKKYGVRGFPTIILTDTTGKEIARTGYQKGGAEAYVEHLKELLEKNRQ